VDSSAELAGGGNVDGIGSNDDPIYAAMKHEGSHIDFPLKISSFTNDQGPMPKDFTLQAAVEADFPLAEIHGTDHGNSLADQA
jgi:hypothetical protein